MIVSFLVVLLFLTRDLKLISFLKRSYQISFSLKLESFRKIFFKGLENSILNWCFDSYVQWLHTTCSSTRFTNQYSFLLLREQNFYIISLLSGVNINTLTYYRIFPVDTAEGQFKYAFSHCSLTHFFIRLSSHHAFF